MFIARLLSWVLKLYYQVRSTIPHSIDAGAYGSLRNSSMTKQRIWHHVRLYNLKK